MTQEEKRLLTIDLCARVPYGVKAFFNSKYGGHKIELNWDMPLDFRQIEDIKPYLRPLSSMTEEEHKEYAEMVVKSQDCSYNDNESATTMVNDWYLSKGFDVRGLIPKGLALEAPADMYNF